MGETPNLHLPHILAAQAQKHVTHNEALRVLDAVVQLSVLDSDLASPPASPAEGARFIVAAGATGAWASQDGQIAAYQDGGWQFYSASVGWIAWVADDASLVVWDGSSWVALGGGGGASDHGALTGLGDDDHPQYHTDARGDVRYTPIAPATLGINATADTTNRLALSSAASLFNHAGNGHQVKVNKNAAGDTASFLFQTGFSGRAEIGTAGNDDFTFKVSPDGSTFYDGIVIDKDDGTVTLPETEATAADYRANTADKLLTTDIVHAAAAEVALTSVSNSVALDMSTGFNFAVDTLGQNTTIANPSNAIPGRSGFLRIKQDATGGRTVAWGANYVFAGGTAPTASTAASAEDVFCYLVLAAGKILITSALDVS